MNPSRRLIALFLFLVVSAFLFSPSSAGTQNPGRWAADLPDNASFPAIIKGATGCGWASGFTINGLDDTVYASALYDDGNGTALYVGGSFRSVDGALVNSIAKWDGSSWTPLAGPSGDGTDGTVFAMMVHDDGSGSALFVGGSFTTAGGIHTANVARWDGSTWAALGGGVGNGTSGYVRSLAAYDDGGGEALVAGGSFATAGGGTVNNIAAWDGTTWSDLNGPSSSGTTGEVVDLTVWDDGGGAKLYASGSFHGAGGLTTNNIAAWDGTTWAALSGPSGNGMDGTVYTLAVYDEGSGENLFAAGSFGTAGGVGAWAIAKWDGGEWSSLGVSGFGGIILTLEEYDGSLIAAGTLFLAGGVDVSNIASWNGSAWFDLSGSSGSGTDDIIWTLVVDDVGIDEDLYIGGDFASAGGLLTGRVARWDGVEWAAVSVAGPPGAGIDDLVESLTVFDDGGGRDLYAGGRFARAGDLVTDYIATWDGYAWSELGELSGPEGSRGVLSMMAYDDPGGPALYAGGEFTTADSTEVNNIARWNGTSWSALTGPSGTGTSGDMVTAMAVHDDGGGEALYVGGAFLAAGGVTVNNLARWNGSIWSTLSGPSGTGTSDPVSALAVYNDGTGAALYAGGIFLSAGGLVVENIARWDGSGWSELAGSLGFGTDNWVEALAVFDDGNGEALYVGGAFTTAGGVTTNGIARWDGSEWSALSGPSGSGTDGRVSSITVYDDGDGEALYVGGLFGSAGGIPANNTAKWDGTYWSALNDSSDAGPNKGVEALVGFDGGGGMALFVGGAFTTVGETPSSRIGKWQCEPCLFADGFEIGDASAWSSTAP